MVKLGELEFGDPWQYDKDSTGVVVPILKSVFKDRNYVTIEEMKEKLDIKDTGSISELEISSKSDKPVFVRNGTMFEGKGTQSRAPMMSVVIMPNQRDMKIPVKCIHQSHHISTGASFAFAGSMPHKVQSCMMSNRRSESSLQSATWNSVRSYTSDMGMIGASGLSDNLVEDVRKVEKFKGNIDGMIKMMSLIDNQVGVVVLDFNGVLGLEMFDSPESWKAVHKEVLKKYADTIMKKSSDSLFTLNKEKVKSKIEKFIEIMAIGCTEEVIFENGSAKTLALDGSGIVGEFTIISNVMIHLIAMRKEKIEEHDRTIPNHEPLRRFGTFGSEVNHYLGSGRSSRGTYSTLSSIESGKSTWDALKNDVDVSPATLSKRLKGFQTLGLVSKTAGIGSTGRAVSEYSLTGKGKNVFKTMRKIRE